MSYNPNIAADECAFYRQLEFVRLHLEIPEMPEKYNAPKYDLKTFLNFILDNQTPPARKAAADFLKRTASQMPLFHGMRFNGPATFSTKIFRNNLETHLKLAAGDGLKILNAFSSRSLSALFGKELPKEIPNSLPDLDDNIDTQDCFAEWHAKELPRAKATSVQIVAFDILYFFVLFLRDSGGHISDKTDWALWNRVLDEILRRLSTESSTAEGVQSFLEHFEQEAVAEQVPAKTTQAISSMPAQLKEKPGASKKTKTQASKTSEASRKAKTLLSKEVAHVLAPATQKNELAVSLTTSPEAQIDTGLRKKVKVKVSGIVKTQEMAVEKKAIAKTAKTAEKASSVKTRVKKKQAKLAELEAPSERAVERIELVAAEMPAIESVSEPGVPAAALAESPAKLVIELDESAISSRFAIPNDAQPLPVPGPKLMRSLCYVRNANRYTNLFFVANWYAEDSAFVVENMTERLPRHGAVTLDILTTQRIADGAFYILDWNLSQLTVRKTNTYGSDLDYKYSVRYDEIVDNKQLVKLEDAAGYLVVYPDREDVENLDFNNKILVRFQKNTFGTAASDGKLLKLGSPTVLLAVKNRLYGPMKLLEDNAHHPYVNVQLAGNKGILTGYEVPASKSPILTVHQSCQADNQYQQVAVDVAFVCGLKRFAYDLFTDKALLTKITPLVTETRSDREKLVNWVTNQMDTDELFCEDDRIRNSRRNRIRRTLIQAQATDDYIDEIVRLLSQAIDRKTDDRPFFEELVERMVKDETLLKKIESHRVVKARVDRFTEMAAQLQEKIDSLTTDRKRREAQEQARFAEHNKKLMDEKRKLEEELARKKEYLKIAEDWPIVAKQHEELQERVKSLANQEAGLRNAIDSADDYLKEAMNTAHAYAFDGAIASKLLQAASEWESGSRAANFEARAGVMASLPRSELKEKDLADYLVETVRQSRDYDRNTILNLYVLLTQSFLTVFSGPPGSGKTSICEILGNSLGLDSISLRSEIIDSGLWKDADESNRFLTVPVERGWTSKRDFIGYYNPLSKTFESVDARRREAFAELDAEAKAGFADMPFVMLLDEANLSPMEYYWGDFMRLADNRTRKDEYVSFGGDATYAVPETLRFLATINNDFTTENLSPRLLDRASIVTLPEQDAPFTPELLKHDRETVSWKALTDYFGARSESAHAGDIEPLLEEIYEAFKSLGIAVSMRTRLAVGEYVSAASVVFENKTEQPAYAAAVDFAVAQRLMPRIDGNGDQYRSLLDDLQSIFEGNGLVHSSKLLRSLINRGESSMGWYRFF